MGPVKEERNRPSWRTARALLEARGVVLSARGAQQEQQAARSESWREGAVGGVDGAAHLGTLTEIAASRNVAGACTGPHATLAWLSNHAKWSARLPADSRQLPPDTRAVAGFRPQPAAPRWLTATLVVALMVHAGVLAVWLFRLLQRAEPTHFGANEMRSILGLAAAVMVLAAIGFRRTPRRAVIVLFLASACALAGIGAVAAIVVMALSAHVIGAALLDWSANAAGGAIGTRPTAAMRMLVGSCIWIGLIAVTLTFPIHTNAVYVVFVAGSLVAFPSATRTALMEVLHWLAADEPSAWPERACVALATIVAVVNLVVVAKPEVGYDASTMHLQFAELVARYHHWDFDVSRYAWAVMPMGADDAYLAAYLLAGESGARLLNLLFGALLCAIVYAIVRLQASRVVALVSVCVLASMPIWFLESSTLYVEFAWTAFLAGAVASTLHFVDRREPEHFAAAAMCCAGAMACKAVGVFIAVPLAIALLLPRARPNPIARPRLAAIALLALAIGAWPYVNAWLRTGNPVFPFMNAIFASPLFPSAASFNNPLYNAPLSLLTPYRLVMDSGRFLEGLDGAAGIQWLLLFPLVGFGLVARERRRRWALFTLAAAFAVAVYLQQSYLRYLLPAFVLVAILGGWALGDVIRSPRARAGLAVAATAITLVNVWLMPSASWANRTLCLRCAIDEDARRDYVADHAPLRLVADYLNRNLPQARVGFFVLNAAAPAGFVGYSRAANWHDTQAFPVLASATTIDDVASIVRRFHLTHAVFANRPRALDRVLIEYRDRDTTPVAQIGNYVVTAIRPQAERDEAASASAARAR